MKIATVSDIHGNWPSVTFPQADVLIFAGDILNNYFSDSKLDAHHQLLEVEKFKTFCETRLDFGDYKHIIFVPGNHDWCFDLLGREARELLGDKVIYLQDSEVIIDGIKFYGSPWTPWFWGWAFNHPNPGKNSEAAKRAAKLCWAAVPDDTNVLITHGPPKDILDLTKEGVRVGCPYLRERVDGLQKLKLHVFGHIHYSHGKFLKDKTLFVNTSICKEYIPGAPHPGFNPIPVLNIS